MKFVFDIEKERYEEFVKSNVKSHFLQSYAWGEFSSVAKGLTPHYVGVTENDKLMYNYIISSKIPFIIIANKADKIAVTKVDKAKDDIQSVLNPIGDITTLPFSSERKVYSDEVWKVIESYL